jgi:F-type H+-transporting ATPase subunit b
MTGVSAVLASGVFASGDETNPLIPAWGEVIIGTIAFAILCWVLIAKAFPQFEKVYQERHDAIEGGIERAEKAQTEAQRTLEQYRAQLAEARSEANRIREEAREQAAAIREELRVAAERDMAARQEAFERELLAERTQVVGQLRREVGEIAVELATRIVGHELQSSDRQRQIVDDFIAGLEAQPSADASAVHQ